MAECSQVGCHELATHRFFFHHEGWRLACKPHAKKAESVGVALGVKVPVEVIIPYANLASVMIEEAARCDLGATGKFPDGQLQDDDEGELRLGVIAHNGHVIINFGTPAAWLGLSKDDAMRLAEAIVKAAGQC